MSDPAWPWPKFDPVEWEFHVAEFAGAKNAPDMMAIAGVLASMADENGLVIADPRYYPDGSPEQDMAEKLEMYAQLEGSSEPGRVTAFRLGVDR